MRNDVQVDFGFSLKFLPQLIELCARMWPNLEIQQGSHEADAKYTSDLVLLNVRDRKLLQVGCRVRRNEYWYQPSYRKQVTVRALRDSGAETEESKILGGLCDYMLYAFADEREEKLIAAVLLDLNVFRENYRSVRPEAIMSNQDGTHFKVYNIRDFPSNFVVAEWGHATAKPIIGARPDVLPDTPYAKAYDLYDHRKNFNEQSFNFYLALAEADMKKHFAVTAKQP